MKRSPRLEAPVRVGHGPEALMATQIYMDSHGLMDDQIRRVGLIRLAALVPVEGDWEATENRAANPNTPFFR